MAKPPRVSVIFILTKAHQPYVTYQRRLSQQDTLVLLVEPQNLGEASVPQGFFPLFMQSKPLGDDAAAAFTDGSAFMQQVGLMFPGTGNIRQLSLQIQQFKDPVLFLGYVIIMAAVVGA